MATNLRDLDEDRRYCSLEDSAWDTPTEIRLKNIAIAALDEIDRLKRLLVWRIKVKPEKWVGSCDPADVFETESDAWAAVRKAASNGK